MENKLNIYQHIRDSEGKLFIPISFNDNVVEEKVIKWCDVIEDDVNENVIDDVIEKVVIERVVIEDVIEDVVIEARCGFYKNCNNIHCKKNHDKSRVLPRECVFIKSGCKEGCGGWCKYYKVCNDKHCEKKHDVSRRKVKECKYLKRLGDCKKGCK